VTSCRPEADRRNGYQAAELDPLGGEVGVSNFALSCVAIDGKRAGAPDPSPRIPTYPDAPLVPGARGDLSPPP